MMKHFQMIVLVGLISLAGLAGAVSESVPVDRKIIKILTYADNFIIKFDPEFNFSVNCAPGNASSVQASFSNGGQYLYSAALAAMNANMDVGFSVNECYTGTTRPRVYRVDVAK